MVIKEKHEVAIESYPFAESLNDNIKIDLSKSVLTRDKRNGDGGLTNVKATFSISPDE